jgi:rubrerythrin
MSELKLSDVDVDGAIRESAEEARDEVIREGGEGDTRLDFFKKAGIAGGAVVGGGALIGALVPAGASAGKGHHGHGRPPKSFGKGDIGILNYALTLEYLEAEFYKEAKANNRGGGFLDDQESVFLDAVVRDEKAHVRGLKAALGKKAVKKPKFDFRNTTSERQPFLETAFALENTGVGAYSGQAFNIKKPAYLGVALSIVTIEARHAGVIGLLLENSPEGIAPNGPFDKPLTARKVLKAVEATGFIQG